MKAGNVRSTIVLFVLTFVVFGLLLGYAASYDIPSTTSGLLELKTDKPEYDKGETVTFTARNVASAPLVFPDSALGISITNTDTGKGYGIIALQVLTSLESGETVQIVWQQEGVGEVADSGNYVARVVTAADSSSATAEVSFRIR
jgi:hypothetical protein